MITRDRLPKLFVEKKAETNIDAIYKRYDSARAEADDWRDLLDMAYFYSVPNYNPFDSSVWRGNGYAQQGQEMAAELYDTTLTISHRNLKNKILTGLVPKGKQWIRFTPGDMFDEESEEFQEAKEFCDKLTDNFFRYMDKSNFYLAFAESLDDLLISTAALAVNEGSFEDPLLFDAAPPSQTYFTQGPRSEITGVYRDWYKIMVAHIDHTWPGAKKPANKKDEDCIDLIEASEVDYRAPKAERYHYVLMTKDKEVLLDVRAASWPWVVYRMAKLVGETRGRGPTLDATPTQATINLAIDNELTAAAFIANPMYIASTSSTINTKTFKAKPGTIIPCRFDMGKPDLIQMPPAGNPQYSSLVVGDLRTQVNQLMMAFPLGPINSPDKTATESQIRFNENLENFMAMVPRLQTELFQPLVQRVLYILNRLHPEIFEGVSEEVRSKLMSIDGELLSVEYETPLMTARGEVKVEDLMRFVSYLQQIVGPEAAAATLQASDIPAYIANKVGVDAKLVKSPQQIQQELDAASQMMAEQQGGIPGEEVIPG